MSYEIKKNVLRSNANQKVWVIGDVHGCFQQFLGIIKSPLIGENDIVILIGDIIDRGPESVRMLDWAMANVNKGEKYIMIRGNHEQNIIDDYRDLIDEVAYKNKFREKAGSPPVDYRDLPVSKLQCNYDFCDYMNVAGYNTVGSAEKYVDWMKELPLYVRVILPDGRKFVIAHAWFEGEIQPDGTVKQLISDDDILWYRDVDLKDNLDKEDYHPMEEDEMLIHGHTPILSIEKYKDKVAKPIFRDYSINIDGGCFIGKIFGGRLIALCLNDLMPFYSS